MEMVQQRAGWVQLQEGDPDMELKALLHEFFGPSQCRDPVTLRAQYAHLTITGADLVRTGCEIGTPERITRLCSLTSVQILDAITHPVSRGGNWALKRAGVLLMSHSWHVAKP